MARLPRYVIPGQPQHIIQRGNNRQAIFAAVADYQFFRDALVEAAAEHGLAIHAYVWMTNHVHLLATPERENTLGKVLQSVGRRYVQYFNRVYQRSGTLWEGRYRATVVYSERYLLTESWFNSFKNERVHGVGVATREDMKATAFEYIEVFYNRKRLHSTLGYKSPTQFMLDWLTAQPTEKQVA